MKYRPEIDGLRALAVLSVIFYHAGFTLFSGGYVGVDVFFVISGYLITSILLAEMQDGRFSILNFYERRMRRILPALFFVMAVCLPFAWLWLLPEDLKDFSASVSSIAVFLSNWLFYKQSSYFDTGAESKPLLHTWSLAVEEQYYVLFPALLILLWKYCRRHILLAFLGIALASLVYAQYRVMNKPEAAFYFLPSRIWELLVGALLAYYMLHRERRTQGSQLLGAAGMAMILYAVLGFDENIPFPSLYTLFPIAGAALIILSATPDTYAGRLLAARPVVALGLISYSAYLWHQPLLSFARHRSLVEPEAPVLLGLIAATLILATLSWKFVEQPFRDKVRVSRKTIFAAGGLVSLLFIAIGGVGYLSKGAPERFAFVKDKLPSYEIDNKQLQEASWGIVRGSDTQARSTAKRSERQLWFSSDPRSIKVLIIGNSHSKDLFNMFALNSELFPEFEFARYGAQLACTGDLAGLPNFQAADVVILSTLWNSARLCNGKILDDINGARKIVAVARQHKKLLVLASNTLEFPAFGRMTLSDKIVLQALGDNPSISDTTARGVLISDINRAHFEVKDPVGEVAQINEKLRELSRELGLIYLEKRDYLCDETQRQCFGITLEFRKSFYDYGHYTLEGASAFGKRAYQLGWLDPVKQALGR